MKATCVILGLAATATMPFIWPGYYVIVFAYLIIRFTIAIIRKEEDWSPKAVLFLLLIGPLSGIVEIIEYAELNEYIKELERKELN